MKIELWMDRSDGKLRRRLDIWSEMEMECRTHREMGDVEGRDLVIRHLVDERMKQDRKDGVNDRLDSI